MGTTKSWIGCHWTAWCSTKQCCPCQWGNLGLVRHHMLLRIACRRANCRRAQPLDHRPGPQPNCKRKKCPAAASHGVALRSVHASALLLCCVSVHAALGSDRTLSLQAESVCIYTGPVYILLSCNCRHCIWRSCRTGRGRLRPPMA